MSSSSKSVGAPLAIEVEILKEKSSALRRVSLKVESLLADLTRLEESLARASGAERARQVTRHRELRAEAEKQR
ncbi:MAG: hypothetical protein ABW123_24660, partial [Cystobacter sp.]